MHAAPKITFTKELSIIKILAPFLIGVADHAHDVAAGVQRERPRFSHQFHLRQLVQQQVAFSSITGMTAGHQVLPRGEAAARAWMHVIQCQLAG